MITVPNKFQIPSLSRLALVLILPLSGLVTACDKDDANAAVGNSEGRLRVDITDAPIDDADVEAVFVTVAEVRVDGEVQSNLSKRLTLDVSALREGRTAQLGLEQTLSAGAHAGLEIDLDFATDADGSSPGCYALLADGTKEPLAYGGASQTTITYREAFGVQANSTTHLVMDMDLRRSVKRADDDADDLTFASDANLRASTRFVDVASTGTIEGSVDASSQSQQSDRVVLFAYAEGSFNAEAEAEAEFEGAVSSTRVNADGTFVLAFLEEGDYELVAVGYDDTDNDGRAEMSGIVQADAVIGATTRQVTVSASARAQIELSLGSLLP